NGTTGDGLTVDVRSFSEAISAFGPSSDSVARSRARSNEVGRVHPIQKTTPIVAANIPSLRRSDCHIIASAFALGEWPSLQHLQPLPSSLRTASDVHGSSPPFASPSRRLASPWPLHAPDRLRGLRRYARQESCRS